MEPFNRALVRAVRPTTTALSSVWFTDPPYAFQLRLYMGARRGVGRRVAVRRWRWRRWMGVGAATGRWVPPRQRMGRVRECTKWDGHAQSKRARQFTPPPSLPLLCVTNCTERVQQGHNRSPGTSPHQPITGVIAWHDGKQPGFTATVVPSRQAANTAARMVGTKTSVSFSKMCVCPASHLAHARAHACVRMRVSVCGRFPPRAYRKACWLGWWAGGLGGRRPPACPSMSAPRMLARLP
jgi:hypothetical protein